MKVEDILAPLSMALLLLAAWVAVLAIPGAFIAVSPDAAHGDIKNVVLLVRIHRPDQVAFEIRFGLIEIFLGNDPLPGHRGGE
jgi:hypothetical protein